MEKQRIIVFGGSSGVGEATAGAAQRAGAQVVIVGRDRKRLSEAAGRLPGVEAIAADASDRDSIIGVFAKTGEVDHVAICVTGGKGAGPFRDLDLGELRQAFEAKTLAQLTVAQVSASHLRSGGSITFVTAASARSVLRGTAGVAAVNGAIEAAVPILALELAPLRVNAVSPGIIDTPWWAGMPASAKEAFFRAAEATLPVRRVGKPEEVARAILFLMQSGFVTGSIYEIDGGGHLGMQ
jgi:NAD(P)-dependent dehydrogenase (short-subunit alcohol dehydrogenase family)